MPKCATARPSGNVVLCEVSTLPYGLRRAMGGHYSLPRRAMKYRVRCAIWQIEAATLDEAQKKARELIKKNVDALVTAEPFVNTRPLWLRILTGK